MIREFLTRLRFLVLPKTRSELDASCDFIWNNRLRQKQRLGCPQARHAGRRWSS